MQGQYVHDLVKSYQFVSSHTTSPNRPIRDSLETNPRQRGGGWLLVSLSCHNAFHLSWHHFQAGQCKHLKTYHCKIFDRISKEGHFQQNLGLGKIGKSSGDENQRPCSASLTADTVRGPLPCMLSGWGKGSPHWTWSSIQQSAQPFNWAVNNLCSLAAKTGQTGLNSKDPSYRYSENPGHLCNKYCSPW